MYRKFTADHIFTGYEILTEPSVLVTESDGVVVDLLPITDAGGDVETFPGLLTPGFINAHCHLELSYLKGIIPEKTGLVEFVQQVMGKRAGLSNSPQTETSSEKSSEQFLYLKQASMKEAERELFGSGTVAAGDICNTIDSLAIKVNSQLLWHNFIEVSGFVDADAEKRLADGSKVYDQFCAVGNEGQTTYAPHAPYSVSKGLFQKLNDKTSAVLTTIHNQECAAENELYEHKAGEFLSLYKNFGINISGFEVTGKTSLKSWLPYFTNNQTIISVHNTFTNQQDLDFVKQQASPRTFFCLCINANRYIEQRIPPVALLRNNDCRIILGTDSYASNRQLNMLEEIKTIVQEINFTIPLAEILQWATINGAEALKMNSTLGSFEKGKKPGIVLITELKDMNTTQSSKAKRIL